MMAETSTCKSPSVKKPKDIRSKFGDLQQFYKETGNGDEENRVWVCKRCHKLFSIKNLFLEHLSSHKGNFACAICDLIFTDQRQLAIHLSKPHEVSDSVSSCEICGDEFTDIVEFEEHICCHFNIKPLLCQFCGKIYSQESELVSHLKLKHPGMMLQSGGEKTLPEKASVPQTSQRRVSKIRTKTSKQVLSFSPNPKASAPESSSLFIDRIDTPELQRAKMAGENQLAVLKDGSKTVIVRVMSPFPKQDLLVPISPEELMSFLTSDAVGTVTTAKIPIVAKVEKRIDSDGKLSLSVSSPSESESRIGFPLKVRIHKPKDCSDLNLTKSGPKIPQVKLSRPELLEGLSRKIQKTEDLECEFADLTDFGQIKD